jgi:hypothetical protein
MMRRLSLTFPGTYSFYTASLIWSLIIVSVLWKRQVRYRGGSSPLAMAMKQHELTRKRLRRRRLRDFLADDMLRKQMIREFEASLGQEEADRKIEHLRDMASREITMDDVYVSANEVMGAAMRWICLYYIIAVLLNFLISRDDAVLIDLSAALGMQVLDNKVMATKGRCVNASWLITWALIQILVSSLHLLEYEIPTVLSVTLFSVALLIANVELGFLGVQDAVCTTRQPHSGSIMEV